MDEKMSHGKVPWDGKDKLSFVVSINDKVMSAKGA